MTPAFSVYLEIARVLATMIVFIGHSKIFYAPLEQFCEIYSPGRDGVIIFFILSGFIISWCADQKDKCFSRFAVNRASRIYSVTLPAILLGIATSVAISLILHTPLEYQLNKPFIYLGIYVSFVGNFWYLSEVPPNNFPYWSLNYEVWYYIIFSAFYYIKSWWKWLLITFLLLLVGPNILQLFPLWLSGSAFYFISKKCIMPASVSRIGLASTLLLLLAFKFYRIDDYIDAYDVYIPNLKNPGEHDKFLGDWVLGAIVLINFIFAFSAKLVFSEVFSRNIHKIASYSFSFYLFHQPIYEVINNLIKPDKNSFYAYATIVMSSALLIVVMAHHTEHKKGNYRAFFNKLIKLLPAR